MDKNQPLSVRQRYSIGEWYGRALTDLSVAERLTMARAELAATKPVGQACPSQAGILCHKRGGVCSLRLYTETENGAEGTGPIVTTCPQRFLEAGKIFRWVGETLLQTESPIVLGEVGFLDKLRPHSPDEGQDDSREFIGRIDNVLVHPHREPMEWCALELQAVYFSGRRMGSEFTLLARHEADMPPFPAEVRRPDWRSSGPKRLLPQLQTKVPTIRTWGKKMAVVIDESFFHSLVGLTEERHLSNAEIIWFVVGYDHRPGGWTLVPRRVVPTRLTASVEALTGGVPLSKEKFEEQLREKLAAQREVR